MGTKICSFIFSLFILTSCFSQSLNTKKAGELQRIIHSFFYNSDITKSAKNRSEGPSEAFLCFLTIDSIGKVGNIHLLADEKNKDSAYSILSNLKASDFKDWKSESCKKKTIMIPLILIGPSDNPEYVKNLFGFRAFTRGEVKNVITLSGIDFYWPSSKH